MIRPGLDFVPRDEKPGPMQKNFDPEELEQPNGALARWHVARTYPTPVCGKQDFWQRRSSSPFPFRNTALTGPSLRLT
jgi:hypothetical protein